MYFQHRLVNKAMDWAYNIIRNEEAPSGLKQMLENSNMVQTNSIETRRGFIIKNDIAKYSDQTFTFFFNKLITNFDNYDFYSKIFPFEKSVLLNLNNILIKFINLFPKFDITYNSFVYLKKICKKKLYTKKKNI